MMSRALLQHFCKTRVYKASCWTRRWRGSGRAGLQHVCRRFPELKIITTEIDLDVDSLFRVVPGVGEFGDRYFTAWWVYGTVTSQLDELAAPLLRCVMSLHRRYSNASWVDATDISSLDESTAPLRNHLMSLRHCYFIAWWGYGTVTSLLHELMLPIFHR